MSRNTSSELCVTLSPREKSDVNFEVLAQILEKHPVRNFVAYEHNETHYNLHIYVELISDVRPDNFRRLFKPVFSADFGSILRHSLRVTLAYSLQKFVNYVLHEPTANMLAVSSEMFFNSVTEAVKKAVPYVKPVSNSIKFLGKRDAVKVLLEAYQSLGIEQCETRIEREMVVKHLLDMGFSLVSLKKDFANFVRESNYFASKSSKSLSVLVSQLFVDDPVDYMDSAFAHLNDD